MGNSPLRGAVLPRTGCVGNQRGQALVFSLFASLLIVLSLFVMFNMGEQSIEKTRLQNTADAAAYSAAVAEARDYNFSAYTNRAMVVNQVAVAQFVGLTSWFRNMSAFANPDPSNWGNTPLYHNVYMQSNSPVTNVYKSFLKGLGKVTGVFDEGKGGSTFMGVGIKVFDGLILVYQQMQKFYHYGTALTVAETLGVGFAKLGTELSSVTGSNWFSSSLSALDADSDVIKANDPAASLSPILGYGGLIYHLVEWFKFTESKDPNTYQKDGPEADRFAEVTLDSLDVFSRDRSTKPAWGIDFFYAPPLSLIDPYMLAPIPGSFGPLFLPVIHRGGTELKVVDSSTGAAAGGGSGGGNTTVQTDCHGNPVSSSTYSFETYPELTAGTDSSVLCPLDTAMVTVGDGSNAAGAYVWNGASWSIQTANNGNTPGGHPTTSTPPSNPPVPAGNRGTSTSTAANSRSKTVWSAMDASSFSGLYIIWITIPVPIPIPFPLPIPAPPWIPLSHGGAQAGKDVKTNAAMAVPKVFATDNNFATEPDESYGKVLSSWMTTLAANMRQSKGAGATLDSNGGLKSYRDVADVAGDSLSGPPILVEIQKPFGSMPTSPGSGRLLLENGAPQTRKLTLSGVFNSLTGGYNALPPDDKYMRALSKSEVYFSRPTGDTTLTSFKRTSGTATQKEVGSLYNPYWQPRLAPNGFWEQYISMEMHRVGL